LVTKTCGFASTSVVADDLGLEAESREEAAREANAAAQHHRREGTDPVALVVLEERALAA
jgi:hypothetical protein